MRRLVFLLLFKLLFCTLRPGELHYCRCLLHHNVTLITMQQCLNHWRACLDGIVILFTVLEDEEGAYVSFYSLFHCGSNPSPVLHQNFAGTGH